MVVLIVYMFLYGRVYLALHELEDAIMRPARESGTHAIQRAMESHYIWQLGMLMSAPMLAEITLERGFVSAMVEFIVMNLQFCSVSFTFSLGTKAHYFGRTILHGGAKYRATGRGFVVHHASFVQNYVMYSRSHFVKGFELLLLLVVYKIYTDAAPNPTSYVLMTHAIWFLVTTWLFAPFIFNPSGFEWQKTNDDWVEWNQWICTRGGVGVPADKSWESWWEEEHSHLEFTGLYGRLWETILSCRFLIIQHGIMTNLSDYGGKKRPFVSSHSIHFTLN
jgi:callose synthase